ncbi:nitroreductase family protein [Lacticaseibacillus paracasei]|uniref:nitroreductase family protein n=1 Tax=Lacticaseibacillus paracasei TaxID=1597 RepID=UPI00210178DC|nr:nitroreductase family protein [Lacticaseibacillus paracasei]
MGNLKKTLARIVPSSFVETYRDYRQKRVIKRAAISDAQKYQRDANLHIQGSSSVGVKELLIFNSHSIEKGLSHPHFRPNFGKNALTSLKTNLVEFERNHFDKNEFAYQNALSVLRAYKTKHQEMGLTTPFFDSLFENFKLQSASEIAGAKHYKNEPVEGLSFEKLVNLRYTQREFADEPVDSSLYKQALNLAMKTPSVCNRQPWHVFYTTNKERITKLLAIQNGYKGYGIPPSLTVITVDRRAFLGAYERNEPYIDGGIFLMNFDLCLTSVGLASCILNLMLPTPKLDEVRNILEIDDAQVVISMIAVGMPKQQLLVAKSARKATSDIFTEVK